MKKLYEVKKRHTVILNTDKKRIDELKKIDCKTQAGRTVLKKLINKDLLKIDTEDLMHVYNIYNAKKSDNPIKIFKNVFSGDCVIFETKYREDNKNGYFVEWLELWEIDLEKSKYKILSTSLDS